MLRSLIKNFNEIKMKHILFFMTFIICMLTFVTYYLVASLHFFDSNIVKKT